VHRGREKRVSAESLTGFKNADLRALRSTCRAEEKRNVLRKRQSYEPDHPRRGQQKKGPCQLFLLAERKPGHRGTKLVEFWIGGTGLSGAPRSQGKLHSEGGLNRRKGMNTLSSKSVNSKRCRLRGETKRAAMTVSAGSRPWVGKTLIKEGQKRKWRAAELRVTKSHTPPESKSPGPQSPKDSRRARRKGKDIVPGC